MIFHRSLNQSIHSYFSHGYRKGNLRGWSWLFRKWHAIVASLTVHVGLINWQLNILTLWPFAIVRVSEKYFCVNFFYKNDSFSYISLICKMVYGHGLLLLDLSCFVWLLYLYFYIVLSLSKILLFISVFGFFHFFSRTQNEKNYLSLTKVGVWRHTLPIFFV